MVFPTLLKPTICTICFSFIALEGIFASLIGHFAYYYALKLGETSKIVPITSAFPVLTVILAVAKFATSGKKVKRKALGLIAMTYGYICCTDCQTCKISFNNEIDLTKKIYLIHNLNYDNI